MQLNTTMSAQDQAVVQQAVNTQNAKNAAANGVQTASNNKELDAMIKRCFNYNIIAVTAKMTNILGVWLADHGYKQLRIAETEKYAHVTFFFDATMNFDGVERPELKNCTRVLINSPKVATYDLQPEMSAYKVLDSLMVELNKNYLDVVTRYSAIAHLMGLSSPNVIMGVRSLINWIQCMNKEMSIETKISDFKNIETMDYFNEIDSMVEGAMEDTCTKTNPRTPTKEDLKMLFTKIW